MTEDSSARLDVTTHTPRGAARFGIAAVCGLLALTAGGCVEGEKAIHLQTAAEFQSLAVQADKPALVMFYKGGCASCVALEPTIDRLAEEYKGRAVVAKFMVLTFTFGVTAPEIKEQYGVVFVPHVVLLVNGREKQHWISEYSADSYRRALDEALAASAPPRPAATAPPAAQTP